VAWVIALTLNATMADGLTYERLKKPTWDDIRLIKKRIRNTNFEGITVSEKSEKNGGIQKANINHRRVHSRILAKVCAVVMATGLVKKQGLKNGFYLFKKIQSLDHFHHLLTTN